MSFLTKVTPGTRKQEIYRDFRSDFDLNPFSKDLSVKTNEEAVKESIKNLILTNKGERLFQPNLGGDIRAMLFENNTPMAIKLVKEKISETINTHEPRATLIGLEIANDYDNNRLQISIIFSIKSKEEPIKTVIFLERAR